MTETVVSIIIPTLNEAANIGACLTALQVFRPACEIIVVDGGSADSTSLLAISGADQVLSSAPSRAKQMNMGATYSQGEILLFLHADTTLPKHAIAHIQSALNSQFHWGRFDITLTGKHPALHLIAYCMNWRSRLTGIATGDQAIFVTRPAFDSVGHYSNIALMEDIDLCSKLKRISPPACLSAKVSSSARRWEHFGLLKTILLMWRLRLGYFFGTSPAKLALLYREGVFWKL